MGANVKLPACRLAHAVHTHGSSAARRLVLCAAGLGAALMLSVASAQTGGTTQSPTAAGGPTPTAPGNAPASVPATAPTAATVAIPSATPAGNGPPPGFVAPPLPQADENNAVRSKTQPGNNAPFWRGVRETGHREGYTSLPGAETGVLIQRFVQYPGSQFTTAGEAWRQVRNNWLIPYGGALLLIVIVAIGIFNIPVFARITRGAANAVWARDYITAARAAGKGPLRITLDHVLPNIASQLIVQATISFATAILAEAALSYLGLGTQPPQPSWGRMLNEAQTQMFQAPLLAVYPGVAIMLSVLGLNLMGDGLRDLMDPKLARRR